MKLIDVKRDWDERDIPAGESLPVFVYGTLRQTAGNHRLLEGRYDSVEEVTVPGLRMYSDPGSVPFTIQGNAHERVVVEKYALSAETLESTMVNLDRLEGFRKVGGNNFYERVIITFEDRDGRIHRGWIYLTAPFGDDARIVEGGDWVKDRNENSTRFYNN